MQAFLGFLRRIVELPLPTLPLELSRMRTLTRSDVARSFCWTEPTRAVASLVPLEADAVAMFLKEFATSQPLLVKATLGLHTLMSLLARLVWLDSLTFGEVFKVRLLLLKTVWNAVHTTPLWVFQLPFTAITTPRIQHRLAMERSPPMLLSTVTTCNINAATALSPMLSLLDLTNAFKLLQDTLTLPLMMLNLPTLDTTWDAVNTMHKPHEQIPPHIANMVDLLVVEFAVNNVTLGLRLLLLLLALTTASANFLRQ